MYKRDIEILMQKTKRDKDRLSVRLSEVEAEIQDILHFLEFFEYSNEQAVAISRKLTECRHERREIKNKSSEIQSFMDKMRVLGVCETEDRPKKHKEYHFKSSVMQEIGIDTRNL